MSWLSEMMHPERGYEKAQEQLDKYFDISRGYQEPFIGYGKDAYGDLSEILKNLLDPQGLQSQWAEGYEESPYAKQLEEMATQRGLDAASSMGIMGSTPALSAIQAGTSQIAAQDRQNYLNDLIQKYLAGAGIAQNIFSTGAQTGQSLGQGALNVGQQQSELAYGKQNARGDLLSKLLGGAAGLAGSAFGAPIGGALGAKLSQSLGASSPGSYNPTSNWNTRGIN